MRDVLFSWREWIGVLAAASVAGCASRPINQPIVHVDTTSGYRTSVHLSKLQNNDPDTLILLAFSGGGTRAAAFSYGVLEELRRTEVVVDGQHRRLLDDVVLITGVSGGSFTALAYALYGDTLFSEYETRFLKRDVQGALTRRALNPFNWPKLIGGSYGRSELAADYYDEILFRGATFADLRDKPTPTAVAAGTDLSNGARLEFSQNDFDLLCSDLDTVHLARAAAASSAVPVVLSPVTFNNYAGSCDYQYPAWVKEITNPKNGGTPDGRLLQRYHDIQNLLNSKEHPYIHLVDGGIADNLGVRAILQALGEFETNAAYRAAFHFHSATGLPRRVVLIVVNSLMSPTTDWDKHESPPGMVSELLQSSGVPMERYSHESVELMRDMVYRWRTQRMLQILQARLAGALGAEAEARLPQIDVFAIDISFEQLADPKERSYFLNLPTSFVLKPEAVDRLRAIAATLLRQSAEYQRLLQELGVGPPK
jgi:NTE family protein